MNSPLNTAFVFGCCLFMVLTSPVGANDIVRDNGLRTLLEVGSLQGHYTFPDSTKKCEITYLCFENGKPEIGKMSLEIKGGKEFHGELLWRQQGGHVTVTISKSNGEVMTGKFPETEFWKSLTGHSSLKDTIEWDGYKIIAFSSSSIDQNGKDTRRVSSNFHESLKTKKYLLAFAIKVLPEDK